MSGYIVPKELKIKDINKNHVGEDIAIIGLIRDIEAYKNNVYVLHVVDNSGETKVVIFSQLVDEFKVQGQDIKNFQNRRAKIIGNVKEYKGNMELVVKDTKSIKIIN